MTVATNTGYAFEQLEPSPPLPRDAPGRLLAQAGTEAEQIREAARLQGYEDGRAQGRQEGLAETHAAATALEQAARELTGLRDEVTEAVERDAVELALALASKLLVGTLQAEPERVLDVVRGALRRITERRRITVLVDPADLEIVTAGISEVQAQAGGIELCEVQSDRRVGRGGAIVRTSEGEVDVSVATALERAREIAAGELGEEPAPA